jgi:NAD-specific glutamate dehydrogenase
MEQINKNIEDVLERPTNYSLSEIFERLKSGRKKDDQLLLQDLIDLLEKDEPFIVISSEEYKQDQKIAYESGFENSTYDQYEDCYELKPEFDDWYNQKEDK